MFSFEQRESSPVFSDKILMIKQDIINAYFKLSQGKGLGSLEGMIPLRV